MKQQHWTTNLGLVFMFVENMDWERVTLLLTLERVSEGGDAKNITKMILSAIAN
jgi:hypothetical protein